MNKCLRLFYFFKIIIPLHRYSKANKQTCKQIHKQIDFIIVCEDVIIAQQLFLNHFSNDQKWFRLLYICVAASQSSTLVTQANYCFFFFVFFLQKQAPIYLGGKSPISWIKFLHYNDTELMTYTTLIHFLEGSTDRYFENRNRNRKCDSFWHQDASKSRTGPRLKAAPEFVHSEVAK